MNSLSRAHRVTGNACGMLGTNTSDVFFASAGSRRDWCSAIAAGAVEALEAATRGAPPEAARDGPRRRLAFASASALANLKPRGGEEA